MSYGHAKAALESKEGAERALTDFEAGVTSNPFGPFEVDGWRRAAWERRTSFLTNRQACLAAGHDRSVCCWEHEHHLLRANHSHWGIYSCPACEPAAQEARKLIEKNR